MVIDERFGKARKQKDRMDVGKVPDEHFYNVQCPARVGIVLEPSHCIELAYKR